MATAHLTGIALDRGHPRRRRRAARGAVRGGRAARLHGAEARRAPRQAGPDAGRQGQGRGGAALAHRGPRAVDALAPRRSGAVALVDLGGDIQLLRRAGILAPLESETPAPPRLGLLPQRAVLAEDVDRRRERALRLL